jgi:alpha-tubulin suppressor-like RCC1 family protein
MKRGFSDNDDSYLSESELLEIRQILARLNIDSISWLEGLATFSGGALLAKILYKLEKPDLLLMCRASKAIFNVCQKYQMLERLDTSAVFMFGNGEDGRLGDGNTTNHDIGIPRKIQNIPNVVSVSCGYDHTGIVTVDGDVYMFGNGIYGVLGDNDTSDHSVEIPKKIQGIPKAVAVSCGDLHTGILTVDGDVYMFGRGQFGRLGDGDTSDHNVGIPTKIENIPKVLVLSCGFLHTGIVTIDGDVCMFGDGPYGVLGDNDTSDHNVGIPTKIQNIPKATTISCGNTHSGIVTVDGDVYMFGKGTYGVLGDGDTRPHDIDIPTKILHIPKIASISCGDLHTGILTVDGDVYMFGRGYFGRLGDGDTSDHNVGIPRKIQNIPKICAISCGSYLTGIITVRRDVYMFGNGNYGNLGDDDITDHDRGIPTKIENIPKIVAISCNFVHVGIVSIPESALNLTISCQVCNTNEAQYYSVHRQQPAVFCSRECQMQYY